MQLDDREAAGSPRRAFGPAMQSGERLRRHQGGELCRVSVDKGTGVPVHDVCESFHVHSASPPPHHDHSLQCSHIFDNAHVRVREVLARVGH